MRFDYTAPPSLLPWLLCALPFAFGAIWVLVCHLLAGMSGWKALRARFPAPVDMTTNGDVLRTATLGLINYRGALAALGTSKGLLLEIVGLYRPGHAAVLVPWADVRVERASSVFGFERVELHFGEGYSRLHLPSGDARRTLLHGPAELGQVLDGPDAHPSHSLSP